MSDWQQQVKNLQDTLNEIKVEVKENRQEVIKLKEEMATGKSAIRTTLFIGSVLSGIWVFLKLISNQ
tara:strand:+ start:124 stop:324 length:201 start_codon:yes stop_codon:yes gene_type:complete